MTTRFIVESCDPRHESIKERGSFISVNDAFVFASAIRGDFTYITRERSLGCGKIKTIVIEKDTDLCDVRIFFASED